MSQEEIDEALLDVELVFGILDLARTLQPGDELPAGMHWEKREHRWWIMTDDGKSGCATRVWTAH
jgi:hypothetical protein